MDAADRDYETSVGAAPGRAHIEEGDNSPPTIPGQATILASSWVFTLSSVFLFLEFLFLYEGPAQGLYYNSTGTATSASWVTTPLINWCGAISCVGWFVGFALLIDWIVFHTFPVFGPSRRALTGAILKLIAAAFFNVQPWSQIIDDKYGLPEVGVPWSNFVGIVFFHAGNCIDAVGMYPMFDKTAPFSWPNLPIIGMWTYCAATWFLVIADGMAYLDYPRQLGPDGPYIGGPLQSSINVAFICPGQLIGSLLLLAGSIIYTYWATFPPPPPPPGEKEEKLLEGDI